MFDSVAEASHDIKQKKKRFSMRSSDPNQVQRAFSNQ